MVPEDELNRIYKQALLIGMLMLVGLPVVLALVAVFAASGGWEPAPNRAANKFMFLMVGLVALAEPFMALIIQKIQIAGYRKNTGTKMTVGKFVLNREIIRFSFVNSVFVLGLVVFLVSRELSYMLYFYIYGLIWAVIYRPRREKIKTLMKSLEKS